MLKIMQRIRKQPSVGPETGTAEICPYNSLPDTATGDAPGPTSTRVRWIPCWRRHSGSHEATQSRQPAAVSPSTSLRSVKEEGVNHVMKVFFRHFTEDAQSTVSQLASVASSPPSSVGMDLVCDEEILENI
jgi:hypothetical protein